MPRRRLPPGAREGVDFVTCRLCGRRFRAISVLHLRPVHGWDSPHPGLEYRERFGVQRLESTRTRELRIARMTDFHVRAGRRWTRQRLKKLILDRSRRRLRLNEYAVRKDHPTARDVARKLFGSWDNLLRACAIRPADVRRYRTWSRDTLACTIQRLKRQGWDLSNAAVAKRDQALIVTAVYHFGSWDAALRSAGLDPRHVRKRTTAWSRTRIIRGLRALGSYMPRQAAERKDSALVRAAKRHFRGWHAACRAAGLRVTRKTRTPSERPLTRAQVLEQLRSHFPVRRPPSPTRASDIPPALLEAVYHFFRSWPAGVRAAGIPYVDGRRVPVRSRD